MSTIPFPTPANNRPAEPLVSRRLMLTVSTAAGLSGLCAVYAAATRPLLSPPAAVNPVFKSAQSKLPGMDRVSSHIPDEEWIKHPGYQIRSGRTTLCFDHWTPTEEKHAIRMWPFAVLLESEDGRPDRAPVTIVGTAAVIRFQGVFDATGNEDPGRIVGGAVQGDAHVRGPEGLDIVGRNFTFSEDAMRLWSDEDVAFKHGQHRGTGRGLEIELFRVGPPDGFDSIAANGVKTLTLRRNVVFDLAVGGDSAGLLGGPNAKPAAPVGPAPSDAAAPAEPLHVTSEGPFRFDLLENKAVFQQKVRCERAVAGHKPDTLDCDRLALDFEPSTDEEKAKAAERRAKIAAGTLVEDDGFQMLDGDLALKSLRAEGGLARIASPSSDFEALARTIDHDPATGATTLESAGELVLTRQGTTRLASPKVEIRQPAGGGPQTVDCIGAGWIRNADETGAPAMAADWTDSLKRVPSADGKSEVITLTGKAAVRQLGQNFRLDGRTIEIHLEPQEKTGPRPEGAEAGASLLGGKMEPKKLVALGEVKLRSPELWADADRLDVNFVTPPPEAGPIAKRSRSNLLPAAGRIELVGGTVPPPAPAAEPEAPAAPSLLPAEAAARPAASAASVAPAAPQPAAPPDPIKLKSQTIEVIVNRNAGPLPDASLDEKPSAAGRSQIREVHTIGQVEVQQGRGEGKDPLLIRGDRLDLFNRGEGQELVHISGTPGDATARPKPAEVHDQGSSLYGLNIHLDRRENRAWVDGEGVIRLPVSSGSSASIFGDSASVTKPETADAADAAAEAKPPEPPGHLDVWWTEKMTFDGQSAFFYGDVRTVMKADRMFCAEMEVRFSERVDFAAAGVGRKPSSPGPDGQPGGRPEVAEVFCRHGVEIKGQEYLGDKLMSVRRAEFWRFHLDNRTGDTTAEGPGWIRFWRRGDGNRAGMTRDNTVRSNAAIQRDTGEWEFLKIDFSGTSDGNIRRRTTTFHKDVAVVYGPVRDSNQEIDPDRLSPEAGWMTCQALTVTRHEGGEDAKPHSELFAEGNVRLEGRTFYAFSDTVSYDESKGLYILRSIAPATSRIYRQMVVGGRFSEASARRIDFNPAKNEMKSDGTTGVDALR